MTERLAAPLLAEDQVVQSMPDVSPTKWHRAHVTWFFETFLLTPGVPGYRSPDAAYAFLFNSYYEAAGPRWPRAQRGLLSRPSVAEVAVYRRHVDEATIAWLETAELSPAQQSLLTLGLHHEQQHQELLLMDAKHVLAGNPLRPAYRAGGVPATATGLRPADGAPRFIGDLPHGLVSVGRAEAAAGFGFDNESPRHEVLVRPFELADRLVTCAEWLAFMADGGYERPELWLSDGWAAVQQSGWRAPLYWEAPPAAGKDPVDGWWLYTLDGLRPLRHDEPVVHVSFFEADAFARWAGARLPTEHEWEVAAVDAEHRGAFSGNLLDSGALHPRAAPAAPGVRQLCGDVWEWTASPYLAYPGFRPAAGAVGEYNGKFMNGQYVLRGGSAVTPGGHVRPTYRNFFPPHARWAFSGLRLAR